MPAAGLYRAQRPREQDGQDLDLQHRGRGQVDAAPAVLCAFSRPAAAALALARLRSFSSPPPRVAAALSDLPNYIGYTWSCKAEYNKKLPQGENCYISGNYTAEALNEVVTKFVQEWILCPKCKNPELNMKVKNKKGGQGTIKFDCSACGYSGKQKSEIMTGLPKMTQHIFNNPPSADTGTQQIEAKQDAEEDKNKAEAKATEAAAKAAKKAAKANESEEDRAIRKAAEKAAKAEVKAAEKAEKEAKKASKKASSPRASDAAPPMTPREPEPAVDASVEVDQSVEVGASAAGGSFAVAAEASAEEVAAGFAAASEGLGAAASIGLLLGSIATGGWKPAFKLLKTHKKLVGSTIGGSADAQASALAWLTAFAATAIAEDDSGKSTAAKGAAKFLHTMYELDVLEEESILKWNETLSEESVKTAVKPIIEFLQEESSDEEESD